VIVQIVFYRHIEQKSNVCIRDTIEDQTTGFATSNQTDQAQLSELMTCRGLRRTHYRREIANAEFTGLKQGVDHTEANRVRQHLESGTELFRIIGRQNVIPKQFQAFGIK